MQSSATAFDPDRERALRRIFVVGSVTAIGLVECAMGYTYGQLSPWLTIVAPHNLAAALAFMGALFLTATVLGMPPLLFIAGGEPEPDSLVTVLDGRHAGEIHVRFGAPWAFFTRLDPKSKMARKQQVLVDVLRTIIRRALTMTEAERTATIFVLTTDAIHDRTATAFGLRDSSFGRFRGRLLGLSTAFLTKAQRGWTGGRAYEYRRWTISATHVATLLANPRVQRLMATSKA